MVVGVCVVTRVQMLALKMCACAPVGMCIKFLESGWNWGKVLYKCAVLLLPLHLFVKQKIAGCIAEMST